MTEIIKIPDGIPQLRFRVISSAINEYNQGVREIPPKSDRGGGVDKYGIPGKAWCLAFCVWNFLQAGIDFMEMGCPKNSLYGTQRFWAWARKKGIAYPRTSTDPRARVPGNIAITKRDAAHGHAMLVLAFNDDGKSFYTIEGNAGQKVDVRKRDLLNPRLLGFVNPYPADEQPGASKWNYIGIALGGLFAYMLYKVGGQWPTGGSTR